MKKNNITRTLVIEDGIEVQKIDNSTTKKEKVERTRSIHDYLENAKEKNLEKKK